MQRKHLIVKTLAAEQTAYRTSRPSFLGRGIERLTNPFGKAIASVVPRSLMEGVLKGLDKATGQANLLSFDHDPADMDAARKAARRAERVARGVSATTGAAAGLGGAMTMSADIPATIAVALRLIRDTGRAFGFEGEGPTERMFRLQVLEVAALDDRDQKNARLDALEAEIDDTGALIAVTGKDIEPLVDQAVERVSRAIAFASFRSRAGMIVPVIGSAVGGIVNAQFQRDVAKAARYAFQARRLKRGN